MPQVARKKSKTGSRPAGVRHIDPREAFHLPVELQLALECAAALPDLPASKSAVMRTAMERYLKEAGWFPVQEANLRRLLEKIDAENLSPHSRAYLKDNGFLKR